MLKLTNTKVIVAGSIVETYTYPADRLLAYNFTVSNRCKVHSRNTGTDIESLKRKTESNKRSMRRASLELRKLVNANAWQYRTSLGIVCTPLFATFTFSDDIRDVRTANNIFLKFIRRLNYKLSGKSKKGCLRYVSVIGFQDKNREGVVHYHSVFFNLEQGKESFLQAIWKSGIVDIKKIEDSENVGLYMSKHIVESSGNVLLGSHKRYFASKGLYKAVEIKDQSKAQSIIEFIPSDYIPKKNIFSGFQGIVKCSTYKLNKGETLLDIVPEIKMFL